ncbi:hypothetical protein P4113_25740 [Pseudomonas aeruginosa]|nr:hypothetical protein [Pseudomonas aeruginosa]MDF5924972.1 hypothetical protein [Pseudomonas aeruginosa]
MADFEYYIKGDMALRCNSEGLWYLSVGDQVFFSRRKRVFGGFWFYWRNLTKRLGKSLGGFCYLNVVLAGLDSESDYWIGLALSWIEQGGAEASDVLLARLKGWLRGGAPIKKTGIKLFQY